MEREEEILKSKDHSYYAALGGVYNDETIVSAMREFARERSIGFAEWKEIDYNHDGKSDNGENIYVCRQTGNFYTTDQLYTLYLESLNPKPIK